MAGKKKYKINAIHPSSWNENTLSSILSDIQGKKILVVGDVGLDRYTIGIVERISPEAPVPVVLVQEEKLKLGLAANVADNIQALGGIPFLLGVLGKDRGADDFRSLLQTSGISINHLVVDRSRRTALKERIVSERQQLVRVDYESLHGINKAIEKQLVQRFQHLLPLVEGVIIEDYAKGMISQSLMRSFVNAAKRSGKIVAVDPNLKTPAQFYRGVSLLTPNKKEAEHLSGIQIRDSDSLAQAGFTILKVTSARFVIMTLGKEGMAIFARGSSEVRLIPTFAREVYDVSGAGDTVISVLMLALLSGANIEQASVLGNLAAGVEVGKRGTATVSADEIRSAIDFLKR